MRTFILVLVTAMFSLSVKAQEKENIKLNLMTLIGAGKNEFADIRGAKFDADTAAQVTYYDCPVTLGAGNEAIANNEKDHYSFYYSFFDYTKTDELIKAAKSLDDVLSVANLLVSSGNYKGRDYKTDTGNDITEVTDNDGNLVMNIISGANNAYLKVIVYAKSRGRQ